MALFDAAPVSPAEVEAHRAASRALDRPVPRSFFLVAGLVIGWAVAWPAAFAWFLALQESVIECGPVTPVMFVRALLP